MGSLRFDGFERMRERLKIDPKKVLAGGGSAGGHVAAATATVEGFNEEGEKGSSVPTALVAFQSGV